MKKFTELLKQVDQTTSTLKKVEHLKNYFLSVSAEDACWGLYLIAGEKIKAKVPKAFLHQAFIEFSGIPEWLFKESYYHVGDSSEAMALLRGPVSGNLEPPALHTFIEEELLTLKDLSDEDKKKKFVAWWSHYDEATLFLIHKCFTGGLRVGVSKNLLVQAMAQVAGVDKETMSFRLMGDFKPTPQYYRNLLVQDVTIEQVSKPYPFFLASPTEAPDEEFVRWEDWCVEWKWDGIRAQLIKREGEVYLWSRGEELINQSFPEVLHQASLLPDGTVIDGELLIS